MRNLERMARELNDGLGERVGRAFVDKFSLTLETYFDLIGGRMVSVRVDGEPLTTAQRQFLVVWSDGYGVALDAVREADNA